MSRSTRILHKRVRAAEREARRLRRREIAKRLRDVDERMLERAEEDTTIRPDPVDPLQLAAPLTSA